MFSLFFLYSINIIVVKFFFDILILLDFFNFEIKFFNYASIFFYFMVLNTCVAFSSYVFIYIFMYLHVYLFLYYNYIIYLY